jgi:peptidylprolyl isomerase
MINHITLLVCFVVSIAMVVAQPGNPPSLQTYLQANQLKTRTTPEGLHYILDRPGTGTTPADGDYVLIQYQGFLLDSTIFDQSEPEQPFLFQVGNREVITGLDLGVRLLKKGGKARLYLPASLGYKEFGVEGSVPPESPLMFEVELLDVMNFDQYDRYMRAFEERERASFELQKKEQFRKDLLIIEDYAASQQLKTRQTVSGLSYCITKTGKGPNTKPGDQLTLAYEGYLTDGTLFEASTQPFGFVLGSARVIQGWEEGLQFFNKGSEGVLIIPSQLAYGPIRTKNIPANTVLIFKIKVLEILTPKK